MAYFGQLALGEIMMHQITRPSRDAPWELTLTDEPVELSPQNRTFLTDRLVGALSARDLPITEEPSLGSPTPPRLRSLWTDPSGLVDQSKAMAQDLRDRQPGTSLPGLLVVATGRLASDEVIVVAKIEHTTAIRIETQTNDLGHQVFRLERLRQLVFGDGAKVYKVAVFSRAASSTGQLGGALSDVQNRGGFAAYFLTTFLGMRLREEPAVLTDQFLNRMTNVINASTLSPEEKLDTQSALVSELKSNSPRVDPHGFIRNHVPDGHQVEIARLAAQEGVPLSQFPKDLAQISSKLRRLRLEYSNGIAVIAPPDEVGEGKSVSITESDGGVDTIVITGGQVGQIRGNGSR